MKVLTSARKRKGKREIGMLLFLRDGPNIQTYRESLRCVMDNHLCIVSDYYLHDSFESVLPRFNLGTLQAYMRELLTSLEFIHSKGVIHRDVKPQNVLFSFKARKLKLIDFGSAEFYSPEQPLATNVGTRFFKAPELLLDYPFYHYSVDIWAAGIIFVSIVHSSDLQTLPVLPER